MTRKPTEPDSTVANVLGDAALERLQLLVELVGVELPPLADEVRRGRLDRGLPGRLLRRNHLGFIGLRLVGRSLERSR
jgi:hypothetical protein